jgi:hypothetical protein
VSRRNFTCRICGVRTSGGGRKQKAKVCTDCGAATSAQAAREMHAKSGPAWDKYVASGQVLGRTNAPRGPDGRLLPGDYSKTYGDGR